MEHGERCEDWKKAILEGAAERVRGIGWARVIKFHDRFNPEFEHERCVSIKRCPFCNAKLDPE